MATQYGTPPEEFRTKKNDRDTSYAKDAPPQPQKPDPSPSRQTVADFHKNASVDTRDEDIHHTIGQRGASPWTHQHRGGDSLPLFDGLSISGSKGGNAALASLIAVLVQYGLKDNTT